jgi:hypothetical protein
LIGEIGLGGLTYERVIMPHSLEKEVVKPGEFEIMLGASSADIRNKARLFFEG